MHKKRIWLGCAVLVVMVLLCSAGNSDSEMKDFVCRVNVSHHPNMDALLRGLVNQALSDGDEKAAQLANYFNAYRLGSSGSGFVYVDRGGNNYIITNYHVVVNGAGFSATFEKSNGETVRYRTLTVFSVNEKEDFGHAGLSPRG